jgi:inosine-uridine nucleoside N-ribohydrolase
MVVGLGACSPDGKGADPVKLIFETDMGNDVDDAMALDMIYKYLDSNKVDVLAIMSNKNSTYSTEYIHLMNHWYGYPDIPIGKVINGIDSENDARKYAEFVSLQKDEHGKDLFKRPAFDYESVPEAVKFYRKILSSQPDSSVTIVSVCFSTNIIRLLTSLPDSFSPLTGKELVQKKVKLLSMMAGSFGDNKIAEYNVVKDIPAAQKIADEWPTPIVFTPFEAGIAVKYPATSIVEDFKWTQHHPVVEAYKHYLDMPYDRPTWDLIALLYVMEKSSGYFTESSSGKVSVDDKGYTAFQPDSSQHHRYLELDSIQAENVKRHFIEIISRPPLKYKK